MLLCVVCVIDVFDVFDVDVEFMCFGDVDVVWFCDVMDVMFEVIVVFGFVFEFVKVDVLKNV